MAAVVHARGLIDQQFRRFHLSRHFPKLQLDRLMLDDRLAKGFPLLGIAQRQFQGALCDTGAAGSHIDTPELQATHRDMESAAFLAADQVIDRYAEILEHHLCSVDRAVAGFFDLVDGDAGQQIAGIVLGANGKH